MGWDGIGISPDRSISRSPSGDNKRFEDKSANQDGCCDTAKTNGFGSFRVLGHIYVHEQRAPAGGGSKQVGALKLHLNISNELHFQISSQGHTSS